MLVSHTHSRGRRPYFPAFKHPAKLHIDLQDPCGVL